MKQMLMHVDGDTLQTAVLENGQLTDFLMERSSGASLVGNIYKGKIVNVLPGMDAAFVDIGIGKNAFLYIDDMLHPHADKQPKNKPPIRELAQPGQDIIVQVVKDPLGGKGARVTTHFNLPGRWLVYLPFADYVGVSKKVASETERERLRIAGERLKLDEEGIIMRTAAEGEELESLQADVSKLRERWRSIGDKAIHAVAPAILHCEEGLLHRVIRDTFSSDMDELWIDHSARFGEATELLKDISPAFDGRVKLYRGGGGRGLFQEFRVAEQIETAFSRRIPMGSGSYLIWEETEALTVIDVNTGKFTGSDNLEDTVFRTNLEAASLIGRLLRVRDVGGIVIIDFIDMEREESRSKVLARLVEEALRDGTKTSIVGWTRLGLMELTRKKARMGASHHLAQRS
ncbi:Rne/Rng family ribonuclease [Paenibacillus agaridevorans]|uniref:Rne/Rng family ribonuclease n=1 Tax=Paenibacillus agaridevorans TaxID=171404 RepID=UPI001FE45223|nr:Rne/Rng family ribonuclease [Paenibacillus agaridevorans]